MADIESELYAKKMDLSNGGDNIDSHTAVEDYNNAGVATDTDRETDTMSIFVGTKARTSSTVTGNAKNESSNTSVTEVEDNMSICLVCGKKARSIEFILPDRYCSQSCADKNGCQSLCASNSSSEFGDTDVVAKSSNGHSSHHGAAGKRKKKRASYLSAYEENFRMDNIDDRKSSKQKKARSFSWAKFTAEEKLLEATESLFINEPPANYVNPFHDGEKLEAIDPMHPSTYCVTTVVEVKGLRLRLHFDGYSECYDFWTYAYSDMIFPVGWCEENGKQISPPKGVTKDSFSWDKYLQLSKAKAAPKESFKVCADEFKEFKPLFQIGDKLEACDIKNNMFVCVASVADTYGNKLLVHFDGWADSYDYWCCYNSPHIHYVGWCQDNQQVLLAPNGYSDPLTFTWESYIEDTKSRAAPRDGFLPTSIIGFEPRMALEAVDKRNPTLVRVAEILEIKDNRVLLHFSGWDNKYDYWEESDSTDLHPPGWCQRTGLSLQPPISPLDIANHSGPCPTPGCSGVGHVKGAKFSGHQSTFGCPYSDINLNKDSILGDRLAPRKAEPRDCSILPNSSAGSKCSTPGCNGSGHVTGKFPTHFTQSGCPLLEANQKKMMKNLSVDTNNSSPSRKRKHKRSSRNQSMKRTRRSATVGESVSTNSLQSDLSPSQPTFLKPLPVEKPGSQMMLQTGIHNSVFLPPTPSSQKLDKELPICWDKNIKLLPGVSNIKFTDVPKWTTSQVAEHIKTIIPTLTEAQIQQFANEQIDGEAFLLLTQSDITSILKLKLGPALKVYNTALVIRKRLGIS